MRLCLFTLTPIHTYTMSLLTLTVNSHKTFKPDAKLSALGVKPFNYFNVSISDYGMDDVKPSMLDHYIEVNVTETREPILYMQIKKAVIELIGSLDIKERVFTEGMIHWEIHSVSYFILDDGYPKQYLDREINTFLSQRKCLTNSITLFEHDNPYD